MTVPYTNDEAREHFIAAVREVALYWLAEMFDGRATPDAAVTGAVFGVLASMDGVSSDGMVPLALVPMPGDDSASRFRPLDAKQRAVVEALDITDGVMLHDELYSERFKERLERFREPEPRLAPPGGGPMQLALGQGPLGRSSVVPIAEDAPSGLAVVVVEDDHSLTFTSTRSTPWRLGHGELVVSLTGRAGGFLASRVFPFVGG